MTNNKFSTNVYNWVIENVKSYTLNEYKRDIIVALTIASVLLISLIGLLLIQINLLFGSTYTLAKNTFNDKLVYYEATPYESEIVSARYNKESKEIHAEVLLTDGNWYPVDNSSSLLDDKDIKVIGYTLPNGEHCASEVINKSDKNIRKTKWYSIDTGSLTEPSNNKYNLVYLIDNKKDCELHDVYNSKELRWRIITLIFIPQFILLRFIIKRVGDIVSAAESILLFKIEVDNSIRTPIDISYTKYNYESLTGVHSFLSDEKCGWKSIDKFQSIKVNNQENVVMYAFLSSTSYLLGRNYNISYSVLTKNEFERNKDRLIESNKKTIEKIIKDHGQYYLTYTTNSIRG